MAAEGPTANCYCCGDDISSGERKKRRWLLSTSGMQRSASILISIAVEQKGDSNKERMQDGYVCRSCCGLLQQSSDLYEQLSSKLKTALSILPSTSEVPQMANKSGRYRYTSGAKTVPANKSPDVVVSFTTMILRPELLLF